MAKKDRVANNLWKLGAHDIDHAVVKKISHIFESTHKLYGGPTIDRVIRLRKAVLLVYRWGATERVAAVNTETGSSIFDMITAIDLER